jgi:hypothetical protein
MVLISPESIFLSMSALSLVTLKVVVELTPVSSATLSTRFLVSSFNLSAGSSIREPIAPITFLATALKL